MNRKTISPDRPSTSAEGMSSLEFPSLDNVYYPPNFNLTTSGTSPIKRATVTSMPVSTSSSSPMQVTPQSVIPNKRAVPQQGRVQSPTQNEKFEKSQPVNRSEASQRDINSSFRAPKQTTIRNNITDHDLVFAACSLLDCKPENLIKEVRNLLIKQNVPNASMIEKLQQTSIRAEPSQPRNAIVPSSYNDKAMNELLVLSNAKTPEQLLAVYKKMHNDYLSNRNCINSIKSLFGLPSDASLALLYDTASSLVTEGILNQTIDELSEFEIAI